MEHIPTSANYVQKVTRIAKELNISIDKASITCDAFELAFSDRGSRQGIFAMIEQLDESAARKGEPPGLIINYGVEIGPEGIRVNRYADEIPAGAIVELTPANRASIFLRINDDFPTQEYLGPLIVNKPGSLDKDERPVTRDDSNDRHIAEPEIRTGLPSGWSDGAICLGPIRLKLNERFLFLAEAASRYRNTGGKSGLFLPDRNIFAAPFFGLVKAAAFPSHSSHPISGLSPPSFGECGHSERKMSFRHGQNRRDMCLRSGSLKSKSFFSPGAVRATYSRNYVKVCDIGRGLALFDSIRVRL
jgi:hypothetical protein